MNLEFRRLELTSPRFRGLGILYTIYQTLLKRTL